MVRVPGTATDLSGLPGEVGQGTPHNPFAAISVLGHVGNGRRLRAFSVPAAFQIAQPFADPKLEDRLNQTGRAANAGWEGLAITPSGKRLLLATQKSLLQERVEQGGASGLPDAIRGWWSSIWRPVTHANWSTSWMNWSTSSASFWRDFLVIERDSRPGSEASVKGIQGFNVDGATDVTEQRSLAGDQLPAGSYLSKNRR